MEIELELVVSEPDRLIAPEHQRPQGDEADDVRQHQHEDAQEPRRW